MSVAVPPERQPPPPDPGGRVRWLHGAALWWLIISVESVNGSLREVYLRPWLGTTAAELAGFVVAALLVLAVAWLFAGWLGATDTRAQLRIGALWAALTLAFEAALAFASGLTAQAFLADYDPRRGGLMLFGLVVLLLAPKAGAWLHSAGVDLRQRGASASRPPSRQHHARSRP